MAQYVVVVTVGNSDSEMPGDDSIENICRELNDLSVMYDSKDEIISFWCGGGMDKDWQVKFRPLSDWQVKFRPLSEVIAC